MSKIMNFLKISMSLTCRWDWISFDRVLSIEMFEHMKNYEYLLKKISMWLKPGGKLFVHIFCHKSTPYDMEEGTFPSWRSWFRMDEQVLLYWWDLSISRFISLFPTGFDNWTDLAYKWSAKRVLNWITGKHYAQTCKDWLKSLLKNQKEATKDLQDTYGDKSGIWFNRWVVFYLVSTFSVER
jgi:cyclopropane fatty-acyl-phospholipid synthase-like methyltransferase